MRRKFVSALLFGAFVTASTSTFVSCKDYDDDISGLQAQIDANKTAIESIQALIAKGGVITDVKKDGAGVTFTMSDGNVYTVNNGVDGANGADAVVWTIGEDGYWYKDGVKTDYYALGKDGQPGAPGEKGDKGDTGAQGEKGDKGDKGDKGE
ncbi:PL29 family lyase N-terminal domain-containing protein, partial [Xylanibacter muris]